MTIKLGTLIQTKDYLQELSGLKLKAKDAFKIISAIKKNGRSKGQVFKTLAKFTFLKKNVRLCLKI